MEVHSVNMNAANQLVALEEAVVALEPTIAAYQQRHHAYKYQIAVNVIFHKVVDPAILTDPPVTLRTTMVAVYASCKCVCSYTEVDSGQTCCYKRREPVESGKCRNNNR